MKLCALALLLAMAVLPCAAQLTDVQKPAEQTYNDQASKNAPPTVAEAERVMQELSTGQFDKVEAQYDAKMTTANAPGKLAQAWGSLEKMLGSYQSIINVRAGKVRNFDVVLFICKFENSLVDAEIAFNADGKIAAIQFGQHHAPRQEWKPPSYAQPSSFTEQPLDLVNGAFSLPGTLTVPNGAGPFPSVVLLQDSGPHDEDETLGPNKPLKDLAWGLASHGIVVYRYTKRTAKYGAKSNADPEKLTVNDEVISDARAAVELLAKQNKVNPKQIYLVGFGLGGYLEPRIAEGDPQIAGIAMLAANTRPLEKVLLGAVEYVAKQDAEQKAAEAADKPTLAPKPGGDAAPKTAPVPDAQDQKAVALAEASVKQIESPDLKTGDTVQLLDGSMPASYWLDLRGYSPVQTAEGLKMPILILQGGSDRQVTPAADFSAWQSAFQHRRNVTLKLYPELNHLFMLSTGPSMDYSKPGHVDEPVVKDIATWISAGGKRTALGDGSN
ncbi:MAG TPA: DUF3887 domain-containing protein [Candidatus Dormibacteraeota bacterium]|nr:DUF3887 domain-containing protein [Candidatus Dormibacteraeota bacterium]